MNMSQLHSQAKPVDILLVDDDEGDVLLTQKALQKGKISNSLSVARDGVEALQFLRNEGEFKDAPRPRHDFARFEYAPNGRSGNTLGTQERPNAKNDPRDSPHNFGCGPGHRKKLRLAGQLLRDKTGRSKAIH